MGSLRKGESPFPLTIAIEESVVTTAGGCNATGGCHAAGGCHVTGRCLHVAFVSNVTTDSGVDNSGQYDHENFAQWEGIIRH
jgi:hypothetical protein